MWRARPGIGALCPVRTQILAHARGTSGMSFMRYIIADEIILPPCLSEQEVTENVITMRSCHITSHCQLYSQVVAVPRKLSTLPSGIVFGYLGRLGRVSEETLRAWVSILTQTAPSSLWLLNSPKTAAFRMQHQLTSMGVDPRRVYFAEHVSPKAAHLARVPWMDVGLSPFPCGARAAASDRETQPRMGRPNSGLDTASGETG